MTDSSNELASALAGSAQLVPAEESPAGPRLVACWRMLAAAFRDGRLTRSKLAVLQVVLDRLGKAGTAWPSLSTIAADACIDRRTASRSIDELVSLGYRRTLVACLRYRCAAG